jgi:hypothetical protein
MFDSIKCYFIFFWKFSIRKLWWVILYFVAHNPNWLY